MIRVEDAKQRLRRAEWLLRPEAQRILALLDGQHGRARAVGGAVRDSLLGLPLHLTDLDIATELTPEEVMRRAAAAGMSAYPTGIEHGTVTLKLDALIAEVTTLREDVETDGRHAVVRFGTDWARDAARRDFTLNALYAEMNGELFDPLGGLGDCLARRVRFIGEPAQRIAEDRLRVYRFFRFSASHGGEAFDRDGLAACRAAADTLDRLAAERVGQEIRRMLGLPRVAKTLKAMVEGGIVDLPAKVLPLLHRYERQVRRPERAARLAILMSVMEPQDLQQRWRLSNDELRSADAVLAVARLIMEFRLHEAAYRHPAAVADGVEVAAVLSGWSDAGKLAVLDQLHGIEVPRFPVRGGDLIAIGLRPNKAMGRLLEGLEQAWIQSGFALDREALLARAREEPLGD